jgi:small subunit ribosomal protein S16
MAVTMRMMRLGKTHRPFYRICVMEKGRARNAAYIENLGTYDPFVEDDKKRVRINKERVEYWLGVGAQPSETVLSFLKAAKVSGLIRQKPRRKRRKSAASKPAGVGGGTRARKPPKKVREPQEAGSSPSED